MNADTKVIAGAVLASALIIVGAVFVLGKDNSPKRQELGTASITLDKTTEDFGSMKVTDEKTASFTITNPSNSTLRIWGITTSCNCTFATVTIEGSQTGEFSMHAGGPLKNWIGEIAPGKNAQLNVIYRPSVMPVQGAITRQVNFSTNDPKNPNMQVSIAANVL